MRLLIDETRPLLPTDPFSAGRLEKLVEIAREYDETGDRDPAAFPVFAAATKRRDKACADRVQIMTIHKSKGLEFDCVFLPFLEGKTMEAVNPRDFLAVREPGQDAVRGVIGWPPSLVADADPTLAGVRAELRAEQAYENLCLLYVAMTRARRELHLVSAPPKSAKETKGDAAPASPDWVGLIASAFPDAAGEGLLTLAGDADWHADSHPKPPASAPEPVLALPEVAAMPAPRGVTPSDHKDTDFSPEPGYASLGKEFGTETHRLFEHLGAVTPDESLADLRARMEAAADDAPEETGRHARDAHATTLARRALEHALEALAKPDFRAALDCPPGARVFNELAYSRHLDADSVESGAFDRVVLMPDGSCRIQDFKTDACAPATLLLRYADTMRTYRAAASALFGLPESRIRLELLHTPTGAVVPVE